MEVGKATSMSIWAGIRSLFVLGKGVIGGLSEDEAGGDPIALFIEWFAAAKRANIYLPEAVSVATATEQGVPSARMMLLKDVDQRGFVFYTNYGSRKADELERNPQVALLFHWGVLQRQVRIEGTAERVSTEESAAYFRTRPWRSRIGAWASEQSAVLEDRAVLETRFREYEAKYKGGEVPLPPFWGGYRVEPLLIEFWQGRLNRLHDRLRYVREGGVWIRDRLYP